MRGHNILFYKMCIRDRSISTEKLVLDDLIYLKTGEQVPADCRIIEGNLEVNESLLTGEADNLGKGEGDELFSGSFVTAGEACCQIIHVGKDNYASQITSEAKEFKRHNSELRNSCLLYTSGSSGTRKRCRYGNSCKRYFQTD